MHSQSNKFTNSATLIKLVTMQIDMCGLKLMAVSKSLIFVF